MNSDSDYNIDSSNRHAVLRRGIWLALLVAIGIYFGAMQYLKNLRISPEELKSRMAQAFPGESRAILDNASQITLYSLRYDNGMGMRASLVSKKGEFHGYPILGKTNLSRADVETTKSLLDKAISDRWAFRALCFQPHHGLRIIAGNQTIDCVICFECTTMMTYSAGKEGSTAFGHAPENYFNQLLESANVPFDPTYKH